MKLLAIDTSTKIASAALYDDEMLVCECNLQSGLTHSQRLMPLVQDCFALAGWQPADIDLFAVVCGPGSFTGVRIGVSAVKGMADALGKPVVPVGTLETLAAGLPHAAGLVVPLLDARRGQVYAAAYAWGDEGPGQVIAPCALALDELLAHEALAKAQHIIFLGDGAVAHRQRLLQIPGAALPPAHSLHQRAAAAGYLALMRREEARDAADIEPVYLRKSQAEQAREERLHGAKR
ncbi:MAG: tRNA (adenosine(37)-N6)-threonylcarbamoyltransferase complex dimerization subunit type 1 TsaB [Eubacteriales bacterium]|nr:tRNA (adenosine(37)-N6)-threonylcarbamoyltransferase complex dimerization subunit type 1 TsaB [Eubacteriales bacterium]